MSAEAARQRWMWTTTKFPEGPSRPHLAPEWVGIIRELYGHGNSIPYISRATGIDQLIVSYIVRRKTYKGMR